MLKARELSTLNDGIQCKFKLTTGPAVGATYRQNLNRTDYAGGSCKSRRGLQIQKPYGAQYKHSLAAKNMIFLALAI